MFTASDMLKAINESIVLDNLDQWIENDLKSSFLQWTHRKQVTVSSSLITKNLWEHDSFMQAMRIRGFGISYTPDQRDGDYYTITIPQ